MKEETLEEAAYRFKTFCSWGCEKSFIEGAKWQQERSYSEGEVIRLAFKFYLDMSNQMNVPDNLITKNYTNVDEWFNKLNPIKKYYEQMNKEVHFNRGNLNK
jgi:hypothetical protein